MLEHICCAVHAGSGTFPVRPGWCGQRLVSSPQRDVHTVQNIYSRTRGGASNPDIGMARHAYQVPIR